MRQSREETVSTGGGRSQDGPDVVYICDWLPPDFGAVGQYSLAFAHEMANAGRNVVLVGLSSSGTEISDERLGAGALRVVKVRSPLYDKARLLRRLAWTFATNTRLLLASWPYLRSARQVLFTGSPPLFLHWIAPANMLLRKPITYRITDFHPECLIAARGSASWWLTIIYRLTLFWRRRMSMFEVLGHDQIERLEAIGIPRERIRLKPDPSPVAITAATRPLARPQEGQGKVLLLYSGNWGVAHDHETFLEGYARHHASGSGRVALWLNAVGARAAEVERRLSERGLPYARGRPVPLEQLASLLITADAHLITLSDAFVGFVLPSKVHGCIASAKPVLYIGSPRSDVHRLCGLKMAAPYLRVDVGDVAGCAAAMEQLAQGRADARI